MEQTQHNASCTALRALRGDEMVEPDEVAQMLRLKALGWGTRRIAVELGVNRGTVKRYIKAGGWTPYVQPKRRCLLDGHEVWLKERFKRHAGNADVVRQELTTELGVTVSLRTLQMDQMAKLMNNDVVHDPSGGYDYLPIELQLALG